jgi:hypothetical protein
MFAAKPRPQDGPKVSYRFDAFGVPQHLSELRQKRIYVPDQKPALRLAHKRTARVSPFTRIAEKWKKAPIPKDYAGFSRFLNQR